GPGEVAIDALLPRRSGDWPVIKGMIDAAGTFVLPEIPGGDFYLRMTFAGSDSIPTFVVSSSRNFDLGALHLGRPDAATPTQPTPVTINASGLRAWAEQDDLQFFSLGARVEDLAF